MHQVPRPGQAEGEAEPLERPIGWRGGARPARSSPRARSRRARSGSRSPGTRCRRSPRSRSRPTRRRPFAAGSSRARRACPASPTCKPVPPGADHWAFAPLDRPEPPAVRDPARVRTAVDRFIHRGARGPRAWPSSPEADRATLIRRAQLRPDRPAADARGDRRLRGRRPARRLRAAGRPPARLAALRRALGQVLARRRRATPTRTATSTPTATGRWPIAIATTSSGRSTPTGRSTRSSASRLAGDELSGYKPGIEVTPAMVDQLVATHFLRNGQDGTGESDGNPDEVRVDKIRGARRRGADHRLVAPGPDAPVRQVPRPQVRAGHAEGVLPAPGDPLPGVQRRELGQAQRPRGGRRPARGRRALGGPREEDRRRGRPPQDGDRARAERPAQGERGQAEGARQGPRGRRTRSDCPTRAGSPGWPTWGRKPSEVPAPEPRQPRHARPGRGPGRARLPHRPGQPL